MQDTAFEALLNKYRTVAERYINFRMPNRFDADDVISETFYAAYRNFPTLQNRDLFKPWLLSIAKNQCNNWYRKKYNTDVVPLDSITNAAAVHVDFFDDTLSAILQKLPPKSAELLKLTMQGYKQKEIADHLKIPVGTVKSRLHCAKKQFRSACTAEQLLIFEKGRKSMTKKDYTSPFPAKMPALIIKESDRPFFEVKFEDEAFIIPKIGNKNSEGTYRYPEKNLAVVSTCYVPKAATVHEVPGVKVCRDTYNVKAGKLYKNEAIWFCQLTDDYIRDLGAILGDADDEHPTAVYTFLEEDYDLLLNGNDRVNGKPLLIKENPPKTEDGRIFVDEYYVRYTMGVYDVTIGERQFETIRFIIPQSNSLLTENFVDRNGRLVLLRWYETVDEIEKNDDLSDNPSLTVNNITYRLIEDRISEYAL